MVVPAFNEEEGLAEFHREVSTVLAPLRVQYEILFVDDGSTDRTPQVIDALRVADPRVGCLTLSRNFGKELALTAGLDHARGDIAITLDADLQHPPSLIPELLDGWREGYDIVYGQRMERPGESWLRRALSTTFYRILRAVAGVYVPPDAGDYRLMSRKALDAVNQLRERRRFMKGVFAWVGFAQKSVPYRQSPRSAGKSKWNYRRLVRLSIEGITSFTVFPLSVATFLGLATASGAFLYGIVIIFRTFAYRDPVPGYPSLMVVILFLGGIQLLTLGVIGEYLGQVFHESKARPLYLVKHLELPRPEVDPPPTPTQDAMGERESA